LRVYAMHRLIIALSSLTMFVAASAPAQQAPPARVGRVSLVSGNLAFHTAGQTEWSPAAVNYPVATGASFWTDSEARAEIRIAPDTIDIASDTELDVAELDERVTRLSVPQGRIYLHLRRLDQGQSFEIDFPRGAVQLLQPGYYDIDAGTPDQPARVAVFEGSAQFIGGGTDIAIKAGDVAVLNGTGPVTATLERAVADTFVEWCRSRDYDEKRLATPYHVSPNMTGYAELEEYGRWDTAPGYGEVWYPRVPAGWGPYTNGRWVWVAPWGWTWVDAEPWGFAPCHYGRWAMIGDSWGWVPGTFESYPVYAPALVGFLGGPGVGLYVSGAVGPQVGWFPLAPGEAYWPGYSADANYIRGINRASVGSIDNVQIMRNVMLPAQVAGAQFANRRFATIAPQHVFASAGKIEQAAQHVPAGPRGARSTRATGPGGRVTRRTHRRRGPLAGPTERRQSTTAARDGNWRPSTRSADKHRGIADAGASGRSAGPRRHRRAAAVAILHRSARPSDEVGSDPASLAGPGVPPASASVPRASAGTPPADRAVSSAGSGVPRASAGTPPAGTGTPCAGAGAPSTCPGVHPHPQSAQQVAHAPQPPKGGGAASQPPKGGGPAPAPGGGGKGEKHD
jgi:FecR protein